MPFSLSSSNFYGLEISDAHATYEDFILEHPTGESGEVHLVGTNIYSWNPELNSWIDGGRIVGADGPQGQVGPQGPIGETGATGPAGDPLDFLSVPSNIVPTTDNLYSLGTAEKRWSGVHIGPGTIYITDTVTNEDTELTVTDGVLQIDGANQLQIGDLKFVDNTIESVLDSTDIEIGLTSSTGDLKLNRNTVLAAGKTFGLVDTVLDIPATLSAENGVIVVDGAEGIRVGDIEIFQDTIESNDPAIDIQLGNIAATADLVLNRNTVLAEGKSLTFPDDTVQTTAYVVPVETSFTVVGGTAGNQPTFNGSPLFSGSYIKTGSLVHFQIQVDMNNITSFGTGQYYMDLPFPSKYGYKFRGGCLHDISATKDYEIGAHVYAGQSRMTLSSVDTQSGNVFDIPFTHNSPINLNVADNFHISGTYITE
jgi:hypothetical protein